MSSFAVGFRKCRISTFVAAAALAHAAAASTFVVDVNGGPGVDFTDIPPALAAASAGDVIIVHAGDYSSFTVRKALALVGEPGVRTDKIQVSNVNIGTAVAISSLAFKSMTLSNCSVAVILNDVSALPGPSGFLFAVVDVSACADVRLRNAQVLASGAVRIALRAASARVEITSSTLTGRDGGSVSDGPSAGAGGAGVQCLAGSDVHISHSTLRGGQGGTHFRSGDIFGVGGTGGPGLEVASGARVLVTGDANDLVAGGDYGYSLWDCGHDGPPGPGLKLETGGIARVSGSTFVGGYYAPDCGGAQAASYLGAVQVVAPSDPSLEMSGTSVGGQTLTFVLRGTPGDAARVSLGREPTVGFLATAYENLLATRWRVFDLGTLPPEGQATLRLTIPAALPPGSVLVAQGATLDSGGTTRLTQSAPIIVR